MFVMLQDLSFRKDEQITIIAPSEVRKCFYMYMYIIECRWPRGKQGNLMWHDILYVYACQASSLMTLDSDHVIR
jgi:hypothetical protein